VKGLIVNCKIGEVKEIDDGLPFPDYPPPPKMYRVYAKKIVTPKRTIYTQLMILDDLTPEEITTLEGEGFTIEEIIR